MRGMAFSRMMLAATAWLVAAAPAWAQSNSQNYDVKTMNFDLWCLETQHWAAARCDKRTPEDEKVFEAYRDQVERYEVPYLQRQRQELRLDRDILHNDPVGNPLNQDPQAQAHSPTEQPRSPSP